MERPFRPFWTVGLFILPITFGFVPSSVSLDIYCLNVGQGDSTLIVSPSGQTMLVDGGTNDMGRSKVVPLLRKLGIRSIDYTVATHNDRDHIAGLAEVASFPDLTPSVAFDTGGSRNSPTFRRYLSYLGPYRQTLAPGQVINLGDGVTVTCLCADGRLPNDKVIPVSDSRDSSIGLLVAYEYFRFWLSGDLGGGGADRADVETAVAPFIGDVDVLRVNHNGSYSSSNEFFLSSLKPEIAVISVGRTNPFGYPSQEALDRIGAVPSVRAIVQTESGAGGTHEKVVVADDHIRIRVEPVGYSLSGGPVKISAPYLQLSQTPASTPDAIVPTEEAAFPLGATPTCTFTPPPTATDTSGSEPAETPVPTSTETSTSTSTPTETPVPSDTPRPTKTETCTHTTLPTSTNTRARTSTETPAPTATPTQTVAPKDTPTHTAVPTDTPTHTAVPTDTPTYTAAPTETRTCTAAHTALPTDTPIPTETLTSTPVPPTSTFTLTRTPTPTPTDTNVPPSLTFTAPPTPPRTPTPPPASTSTSTPIPSPTETNTPGVEPSRTPLPVAVQDESLRKANAALVRAERLAEIARKFAAIDTGSPDLDEKDVKEYRVVLSSLLRKYRQEPDEISEATLDAQNQMATNGQKENLLSILRNLNQVFPTEGETRDYSLWLSGYTTVRSKGHSPAKCVEALRFLTEEMGHP